MTIIYQYRVATTSLGGFLKLLKAWKGSVYKLLYKELLIFVSLYAAISLIYRFALNGDQRTMFEGIVLELYGSTSAIPLSFLLGFYVTFIAQRWWQQFTNVPWPDRTLFTMVAYLHGLDDRSRMMRRTVARYMLFGLIWICRAISVTVMKRFPTLDHIVEAGFITKEEKVVFESVECKYQKFFVPMMWANQILVTARREGKIDTDFGLRMILQPLADFRDRLSLCFVFDWITVPLVYTQVVTFAVYSYFVISLFGQQYLDPSKKYKGFEQDFYVPGFSILQFLFYMGWLKVAEQMINPFGEDDDDFDINWLLDRHTGVAFTLVDKIYGKHPDLVKDGFWNDPTPDVPYTESSARSIRPNFLGSTFNIEPTPHDHEKMLIADSGNINQHEWTSRPRGKSFMTDSLLSLFHLRSLHQHTSGDSQSSLGTDGSGGHGNHMSNGRAYDMIDKEEGRGEGMMRRSSVDMPVTDERILEEELLNTQLRERSLTDNEFRGNINQRKMSLPFSINLFKKPKRLEPLSTLGSPRFTIEPVKEEVTRRPGHSGVPYQSVVSRIPVLSAIEEGNTVSSLKQLVGQLEKNNNNDESNDVFAEGAILSDDDDKAYEDCISYVDETNSLLSEFSNKTSCKTAPSSPLMPRKVPSENTTIQTKPVLSEPSEPSHSKSTIKDSADVFTVPVSQKQQVKGRSTEEAASTDPTDDGSETRSPAPKSGKTAPTFSQISSKCATESKEELAPLIGLEDC